ncbi:hypothetical protein RJ639_001546 [Escallonia herrerae]|uniref:Reverse transcriptase/retrotransposon-derived protein RNase H-like domain-containing protein n=1 Tax=Escallonia herrerae TaxID=1293975 RepID=A0AA88X9Q6_9ASTE|nr:hypothetical protein RJ639_001546 [Escallonia herrerae]
MNEDMSEDHVLVMPYVSKSFKVRTDSSNFVSKGLMQEYHLIAYECRKLNNVESRCTTHEKELLAVYANINEANFDLHSSIVLKEKESLISKLQ